MYLPRCPENLIMDRRYAAPMLSLVALFLAACGANAAAEGPTELPAGCIYLPQDVAQRHYDCARDAWGQVAVAACEPDAGPYADTPAWQAQALPDVFGLNIGDRVPWCVHAGMAHDDTDPDTLSPAR